MDTQKKSLFFGIKKKISNIQLVWPEKCLLYLKLPWIGNISLKYEKQTKLTVNNCFGSVSARIISLQKDVAVFSKGHFASLSVK